MKNLKIKQLASNYRISRSELKKINGGYPGSPGCSVVCVANSGYVLGYVPVNSCNPMDDLEQICSTGGYTSGMFHGTEWEFSYAYCGGDGC